MPSAHAKLSPSGASRWLACPASIRMSEGVPDSESPAAREGTIAHALGEIEVRLAFNQLDAQEYQRELDAWASMVAEEGYTHDVVAEMQACVNDYVDLVIQRQQRYPDTVVFVERRVNTGVPHSWGTSDIILVSPQHVEIIDLKYGKGIQVWAAKNPQLRLYACGALDEYGHLLGDVREVFYTVFQPRLEHTDTERLTAEELLFWRREVAVPGAELALTDDAPFGPSEEACKFCPAAGFCRARTEAVTREEFGGEPDELTPEEIGQWLGRFKEARAWMDSVEKEALDRLYERGEDIPGWKAVVSGGVRKITDHEAAMRVLVDLGFNQEDVASIKLVGLGVLDKLVGGKDNLPGVLGPLLGRTEGKPSLAREEDKRDQTTKLAGVLADFD